MYKKIDPALGSVEREKQTVQFWNEHKIFEKTVEAGKGRPTYTFYDGPPTANGRPHIGHVLTRVIKDMIPRYRVMKGYDVPRKAGWDTHGLPVELEVEKLLGLNGMEQIEVINYLMDGFPMVYCGNEIADMAHLSMFANRFHPGKYEACARF